MSCVSRFVILLILGALAWGCAAPRIAGKTVSGVTNGAVKIVEGATKVLTAPLH
ncbi:MAG: hypothetical protein HYV27_17380 [Candidatus Hydrogenedentes bacterium]|nr:hypothetical protein [Candidatus Hydrogenedentota bacterium]